MFMQNEWWGPRTNPKHCCQQPMVGPRTHSKLNYLYGLMFVWSIPFQNGVEIWH